MEVSACEEMEKIFFFSGGFSANEIHESAL